MANGAPDAANHPATRGSGIAPRLSELETKAWVKPASISRSSRPLPRSAV